MFKTSTVQMCGFWSAVVFLTLWLFGFVFAAQWVPPLPPSGDAAMIGAEFSERSTALLVGSACMGIGSIFYVPFTILIADFIRKIESPSIMLSSAQIAGGVIGQITFFIPSFIFAAAAFRPDRSAELILAMSDVAWITFMTAWPPFCLQFASLGIAIFMDQRTDRPFPRWVGFLQFWNCMLFFPATLALFFKTGPFAWNGMFIWWVPLLVFVIWFAVLLPLLWRAIRRGEDAGATFSGREANVHG
jgi:hypothetical protein